MPFEPNAGDILEIDGQRYAVAEHPAAPGMTYGQEGRAGTVYRLVPSHLPPGPLPSPALRERGGGDAEGGGGGVRGEGQALKVFKPRFRLPYLVSQAERIGAFAALPGLAACRRVVLTPTRHADLLRQHPDLTYAVLMPWIEGPTWQEVLLDGKPLSPQQSLALARGLADVLVRMEEQGIAHCDLSAPNVLLPALAPSPGSASGGGGVRAPVELIDLEGLYAPGMTRPRELSSGSAGYAHRQAAGGLWGPEADRFAGAVLLVEMLGYCDSQAVQAAWGESYFEPGEMQQESERYRVLVEALRRNWGEGVAALFERAWRSDTLADCPTFGEWLVALPEQIVDSRPQSTELPTVQPSTVHGQPSEDSSTLAAIRALMDAARQLEEAGKLDGALVNYRQAQVLAQSEPALASLAREIGLVVQDLEGRGQWSAPAIPVPVAAPTPLPLSEPRRTEETVAEERSRRRGRGWTLGIISGLAVLICLGVVGTAWFFFRPGAAILQTTPTVVKQSLPAQTPVEIVQPVQPLPTYTPYPTYTPQLPFPTQIPTSTPIEETSYSPPSGRIVFTCQISRNSEQNEICMINADGSGFRQLTNNGANNGYASFAPDGQSIVFASTMSGNFQIYELNLNNGGLTQLTYGGGGATAPDVSPDGRQIVYKCSDENTIDYICVMNRDGSNIRRIYSGGWDPVWSPDGTKILFAGGDFSNPTFYIIFSSGSGLQALPSLPNTRGRSDWSNQGVIASYAGLPWQRNIYILEDSDWKPITNGGNSQAPSFSPDGQWIAFTAYFDHMNDPNGCEIYIMAIDGENLTRLTYNDYCDWQPRWGP